MTRLRIILVLALGWLALPCALRGQSESEWMIKGLSEQRESWPELDFRTGIVTITNGVMVSYAGVVLTADTAAVNERTAEVVADGNVRIQQGEQLWASEHVRYNFRTREMEADQFRTGQAPVFASGRTLRADVTNRVYIADHALLTTDDVSNPAVKVRARSIKILPGKRMEARDATLYVEGVPVFYFPYYSRSLNDRANNFNFTPGYRSVFGPYLMTRYTWFLNDEFDGLLHLDYREKRGPGVGPDVNFHLGPWGAGTLKYYYTHDQDTGADANLDVPIPDNRQRVSFDYQANPATNLAIKAQVRYQSDAAVVRDFFEGEYGQDSQPKTFVEVNKFWQNFSLDTYVQPRVNNFLETVERLPDFRLTGFRQQIGATPVYYESESSVGYFRRRFAVDAGTNGSPAGLDYAAGRADTYHQLLLPNTFFGFLNVTPRAGGRYTYYGTESGVGAKTDEVSRGVFNTGAEISFKASRLWPAAQSDFLDVDGLRHIIEPSANYVYVPRPNVAGTNQIPQFDFELPSLRLLPIDFPDYNAIDSIDSQNVIRWGLHNKLQTKREGEIVNLLDWNLYTDWRLRPRPDQGTFADLYSDLTFRPRSWLTFASVLRYDLNGGDWRMAVHTITFQPNKVWSWTLGHFYLRDDVSGSPTSLGIGNNLFTSMFFYRLNENWGFRFAHQFEARDGILQEQSYTVYRDLRSWTAALSFVIRDSTVGPEDFGVAFTFSLKAFPRFGLGSDAVRPASLLGG